MLLIKRFLEETNQVVGRLLIEYNSFDAEDEVKWNKVSTRLTDFVQEVKTDERLPLIHGAPQISKLHQAYMSGDFKLFTHEINMHLLSTFSEMEVEEISKILGRGYYSSMQCDAVGGETNIELEQAIDIFRNNRWLISLYMVRMNFFTSILPPTPSKQINEA